MEDHIQIGCSLGVLEQYVKNGVKITDLTDDEGIHKVIPRVCMFRRDENQPYSSLYEETFIPATFIIISDNDLDGIAKTIESLNHVISPKSFKVIICHTSSDIKKVSEIARISNKNTECVYLIDKLYKDIMYDEAFRRSKNGWSCFVKSGYEVDPEYLEVLNFSKNSLLLDFVAVNGEFIDSYMSVIYKLVKGYRGASVKEKLSDIKDASISEERMYENYRNDTI